MRPPSAPIAVLTGLMLAATGAWAATPARAADLAHSPAGPVTFGTTRITIAGAGARAIITRDPYRLVVQRGDGAPALSEARNRLPRPLPVPPTADPISPGLDNPRTSTLYAPLSFLVGSEHVRQYHGGPFGGNLQSGTRQGTLYSARRVLSVRRSGDGVRLTLATDDPGGRRLVVTIRLLRGAAIGVRAVAKPGAGVAEIGDSFASTRGEGFFGFGGRHNAVDQHGNVLSSWVSEENLHVPSRGPRLYPNGPAAAYYPQPELFSSRPYGFLLDQPQLARFKLDVGGRRVWNVTATARSLRYVVAPGRAPHAIRTLTALSGRQPAPPRWGLGPMMDRLVKNVGETGTDYESDVRSDLRDIRRYRLPLTAYRLEGWGFDGGAGGVDANHGLALHTFISRSAQRRAFRSLQRLGVHPLVYLRPWLTPGSAPVRRGLEVRTPSGAPYYTTSTTGVRIALLDFTNPAAVRFWQRQVAKALNLGADGFMQDFGEEVLTGMRFNDGDTGATMHNRYPVLAARATRGEFSGYERAHPDRTLFFFTRAGYTGMPGSAGYENANFPGDETTDWSHASGLRSLTSDMLGRAVDGAYGYGTDIGGYYDITTPATTRELFLRWAEWAALSPVFRLHGSGLAGTHAPWSYGPATLRTYEALSRLHLRAAPLIMRLWHEADATGMPVTRPLWLQFGSDRATYHVDQEWMLGPDVLVTPVVREGARARSVYFPRGCWQRRGGARHHGPGRDTVAAPLDALPYFVACGTHPLAVGRR